jgi:phosphoribosyl 1,2-cyclic phosphate phosphodiesterase
MKLRFLGTGAAEGIPGLWCTCERCKAARQEGGRSIRLRCMLLIDDRLLIDCGPDLVAASIRDDLDLSSIRTLLITHEHSDHLYLPNLEYRQTGFCPTPLPTLEVYGSASAIGQIRRMPDGEEAMRLRTYVVSAFQTWEVDGYRVTAFRARHGGPSMEPLFYAIGDDHGSILYAHDTGPFPEETWEFLTNPPDGQRWAFDLVSIDMTSGLLEIIGQSHMTFQQVVEHRDRLAAAGLLRSGARVLANHFSHNGNPAYRELTERISAAGIESTYDGLMLRL